MNILMSVFESVYMFNTYLIWICFVYSS